MNNAKFILRTTTSCEYGADVLGGSISYDNPYVIGYPRNFGEKHFPAGVDYLGHAWVVVLGKFPGQLEVGEAISAEYSLSSSKGTYLIHRIS